MESAGDSYSLTDVKKKTKKKKKNKSMKVQKERAVIEEPIRSQGAAAQPAASSWRSGPREVPLRV